MTQLTNDCIYDILKYLKNDRSTLFSCLLLNRFWCKETVPLLYENPFENYSKNNHSIIWTLILCFNETEILQLKNHLCIKLQNNNEHKPLFEYTKYLKNIDSARIIEQVVDWIRMITNDFYKNLDNIITIFYHSIIRQCTNIKYLNIRPSYFLKNSEENIDLFTSNLSKLNILRLNFSGGNEPTNNDHIFEFLQGISKNCSNILKLEINLDDYSLPSLSSKFCSIIKKQKSLKAFKINYKYLILNDIFLSLEFQKYSLGFIKFENVDINNISFEIFINLCNLKYLRFHNCRGESLDQCEILKFSSFKLRELKFKNNTWNINVLLSMIKYLGNSLQRLLLLENLTIPLIENILIYCTNLVKLEIIIDPNIDLLVFHYLKNLKIRILYLKFIADYHNNIEIFINLGNNIPTSVKEISIHFNSYFNILHFEKFLENCHGNLEIINSNYLTNLEFLKIILNYIERNNNSLLFLGILELEKEWNDDEINLLDKIKSKGVNIVEFNSKKN